MKIETTLVDLILYEKEYVFSVQLAWTVLNAVIKLKEEEEAAIGQAQFRYYVFCDYHKI